MNILCPCRAGSVSPPCSPRAPAGSSPVALPAAGAGERLPGCLPAGRAAALCLGVPAARRVHVLRVTSTARMGPTVASFVPPGYPSSECNIPCSGWLLQELVAMLRLSPCQVVGSDPSSSCP